MYFTLSIRPNVSEEINWCTSPMMNNKVNPSVENSTKISKVIDPTNFQFNALSLSDKFPKILFIYPSIYPNIYLLKYLSIYFRVIAVNSEGESEPLESNSINAVNPYSVPSPPRVRKKFSENKNKDNYVHNQSNKITCQ